MRINIETITSGDDAGSADMAAVPTELRPYVLRVIRDIDGWIAVIDAGAYAASQLAPTSISEETTKHSIIAKLDRRLTANREYLALDTPTTAQITNQVRRLTIAQNALIRLALRSISTPDDPDS